MAKTSDGPDLNPVSTVSMDFSPSSVISSFNSVERMLHDFMYFVPYCDDHEKVWSPRLATVLLEAGSQLDSLWKVEGGWAANRRPNIKDYFEKFGEGTAYRWLVLWGEKGERIQPFAAWSDVPNYSRESYKTIKWWDDYNEVKHNRLQHQKRATLKCAAQAVAGLFIAIVHNADCAEAVVAERWVLNPDVYLKITAGQLLSNEINAENLVAESEVFSHLVHGGRPSNPQETFPEKPPFPRIRDAHKSVSPRFKNWLLENQTVSAEGEP